MTHAPRRLLMVAYFYPPVGGIGAAGAQRALKFAKYLPAWGWRPVVLTVRETAYETYLAMDESLGARVPAGIPTVRTPVLRGLTPLLLWQARLKGTGRGPATAGPPAAPRHAARGTRRSSPLQRLKDGLTECFELPDEEMGWLVPGVAAGLRAIRHHGVDAIWATGRPWSGLVIGLALARLTGRPLVTDFRDPWMTNPFRPAYSPLKERVEARLERAVVRGSALVVANTDSLRDEFRRRFPAAPAAKFVTLLNGFDPDDFPASAAAPAPGPRLVLTHTGFLYGKRDPRAFLEAVRRVVAAGAVPARELAIRFVGPVELPYALPAALADAGLGAVVSLRDRVSFAESLRCLAESSALLLLQPGTETQVPSKLFEYVGMGRPILALSPLGGATARLVREANLGEVADAEDVPAIADALTRLHVRWKTGALATPAGAAREQFNIQTMTGTLARHLDDLAPAAAEQRKPAWTSDPIR